MTDTPKLTEADFSILQRSFGPKPHPELMDGYEQGRPIPGTRCLRLFCNEPRWEHPTQGEIVLCKEHGAEFARGECHAPPLRQGLDYSSIGRKTFLVEQLPDSWEKK